MKLENIFESNEPMQFWHGGNLDLPIQTRSGKWEYGPGLYLTTHYGTAKKYAKGNRKFYRITVEQGSDSNNSFIPLPDIAQFVNTYCIVKKRKEVLEAISKYEQNGSVVADRMITIIINYDGLRTANVSDLREFLVKNGVDYTMVSSPFGWGEKMMVLYNMNKIISKEVIGPKDKIEKYDLHD
jgi:hypothetical protein